MFRSLLKDLILIIEFELRALWYDKPSLLRILIIEPYAYLLFLAGGLSGISQINTKLGNPVNYFTFVYPGIIGLQLIRIFIHTIYRLTIDRRWGLQAIKMAVGIRPLAYLLGFFCVQLFLLSTQILLSLPIAILLKTKISMPGLFCMGVVGTFSAFFLTCIALFVSFYFKTYSQRDMLIGFMMLPLSLSAPIFYNLQDAPTYLKIISICNPLSYQVLAMREAFLSRGFSFPFYIILLSCVFLLPLVKKIMSKAHYLPSEI